MKQTSFTNNRRPKTRCNHCLPSNNADILLSQKFNKLTVIDFAGYNKNQLVLWNCKCDCGQQKIVSGYDLKRGGVKSCGCLYKTSRLKFGKILREWHKVPRNKTKYLKSLPRKNKHHNFNPKLTDEDRKMRKWSKESHKTKQWRKLVIKRDKECICCGSTINLRVHHKLPWKLYPKLRTKITNGCVLCNVCHTMYHKQYGIKENCNPLTLKKFIRQNKVLTL